MKRPFRTVRSGTLVLANENIDTDQILPARFLTGTHREGWGGALFADWRYDERGRPRPDSPFDRPGAEERRVLVAGRNLGCGSSREHAVWGLRDFGIEVVISTALADIFRRNALKNGLLAFEVGDEAHRKLLARPGAPVTVDLESTTLTLPDGEPVTFSVDAFARTCLLEGVDEMEYLLARTAAIERFEDASPRRSLEVAVR